MRERPPQYHVSVVRKGSKDIDLCDCKAKLHDTSQFIHKNQKNRIKASICREERVEGSMGGMTPRTNYSRIQSVFITIRVALIMIYH